MGVRGLKNKTAYILWLTLTLFSFSAWIVSLAYFPLLFSSPVAGRLLDKFSCRFVTMLGVLSSTVGLVLASFAKSAFVYYLTYSLFVGFGICCLSVSGYLVVAKYFHERRPFAARILMSPVDWVCAGTAYSSFARQFWFRKHSKIPWWNCICDRNCSACVRS